jgi:hypothetical protein
MAPLTENEIRTCVFGGVLFHSVFGPAQAIGSFNPDGVFVDNH